MNLGVVILNWNQADDTLACVRRVCGWPMDDIHLWVVDNGSCDADARRLADALPAAVTLLRSEANLGFAGGNNIALRQALQANCQAVMLMNNDAYVDADAAQQLCLALEQHPRIGILGPVLVDAEQPDRILSAGGRDIAQHLVSHHLAPIRPGELRVVDYVPGTCVVIRASLLREVGLFDEAYFFGGELADLCLRAKQRGWLSAVTGSATVAHALSRSAAARQQLHAYYVIRNRFRYIRKFYPRAKLGLFALWTLFSLYEVGASLSHRQHARARAVALGCLDGWRGRFGGQNARVTRGRLA